MTVQSVRRGIDLRIERTSFSCFFERRGFFFVGIFEAMFERRGFRVSAKMGKHLGSFQLPKLVELGFGCERASVNAVKIFKVGQIFCGPVCFAGSTRHPPARNASRS